MLGFSMMAKTSVCLKQEGPEIGLVLNKAKSLLYIPVASIPGRLKDGLVHTVCICINRPKNLGVEIS